MAIKKVRGEAAASVHQPIWTGGKNDMYIHEKTRPKMGVRQKIRPLLYSHYYYTTLLTYLVLCVWSVLALTVKPLSLANNTFSLNHKGSMVVPF